MFRNLRAFQTNEEELASLGDTETENTATVKLRDQSTDRVSSSQLFVGIRRAVQEQIVTDLTSVEDTISAFLCRRGTYLWTEVRSTC